MEAACIADVLSRRRDQGDLAATFIGTDKTATHSFSTLFSAASSALGRLQDAGVHRGDTLLLSIEDPERFFILLWACFLGGIVASPVSPVAGSPARLELIRAAWGLCGENLIVCDNAIDEISAATRADRVCPAERLCGGGPSGLLPAIAPDDAALLPFTSGSTGTPKGILLTHRNILSMVRGTAAMNGFGAADHTLNWMPPEHPGAAVFLGVLPAWLGAAQVHVKTGLILSEPLLWLRLMTDHATAISWAPNFAFSMISDAVASGADAGAVNLERLHFLVNAGEQVKSGTVLEFLDTLSPLGLRDGALRPAFGMAESCSGITWSSGLTRAVLQGDPDYISLGRPIPGAELRIVDETGVELAEGAIGQLEMRGPSVTGGYYRNPSANALAYTPDGWFRTGDLAFLQKGELHVTGRSKDEFVLNGRNIPFHLIEKSAEQEGGVLADHSSAFALPDPRGATERLALVFCPAAGAPDRMRVAADIRRRLAAEFGVQGVTLICVAPATLPRTSIGKIQRRKLKDAFLSGTLDDSVIALPQVVDQPMPPRPDSAIETDVQAIWQDILGTDQIRRGDNFFDLGGQSILLTRMHARLVDRFGSFPLSDLFLHPTVAAQAAHFGRRKGGSAPAKAAGIGRSGRATRSRAGDIAIIGMACRFPGAETPAAFWANLLNGVDAVSAFSADDAIRAGVGHALVRHPHYVRATPRLADAASFDAAFFGFTARDAAMLDPQHRVFLEVAWEAFEDAGYDPLSLRGTMDQSVGVYAGAAMNTYLVNNVLPNLSQLDPKAAEDVFALDSMSGFQAMVANDKDYLSTRVSYKLDLRGPSINLQTACSSGLVVIHEAVKAIRAGDCRMALAGTASVKAPDAAGHLYRDGMIVSRNGQCRAFDADASGTIFGSGVGAVLLKGLDDALADGDRIVAVIKGSAVNNDGRRKVGYMAPSQDGETDVTAAALLAAGVTADSIGLVEAHGTGTLIGDPIEVESLTQAFRQDTDATGFCALGAVKTNVGHLQISSGMAGVIKAALAVRTGRIPANLHFQTPNPQIDFGSTPFFVPTRTTDWPLTTGPRRASVNSLGIGGTNAHLVLEQPPERAAPAAPRQAELLVLSARDAEDFEQVVSRLRDAAATQDALADVAFTLAVGRRPFAWRKAVVVDAGASLSDALADLRGTAAASDPRTVFAFTGQGAQYCGMALALYQDHAGFRRELDRCAAILSDLLDRPLTDLLRADEATLARTDITQPVLFAVEYALARCVMDCGLTPVALIGHSLGEYVAAALAGVFPLEDALRLVVARGQAMAVQPGEGAMLAVMAGSVDLSDHPDVQIAARNSPGNTVLSGPRAQVDDLAARLTGRGTDCRPVATSHAFHSRQMAGAADALRRVLAGIVLSEPEIPLVSNLTGRVESGLFTSADYWVQHMLQPVDFQGGVAALRTEGLTRFLEIGPHPVLSGFIRAQGGEAVETLRRGRSDLPQVLGALGRMFEAGHDLTLAPLFEDRACQRVALPTYPFKKTRHWLNPAPVRTAVPVQPRLHPLVHRAVALPGMDLRVHETDLQDPLPDWVTDHIVRGRPLVAGAAHLAMLTAAAQLSGQVHPALSDIRFVAPLYADHPRKVQVRQTATGVELVSFTPDGDDVLRHVTADLEASPTDDAADWTLSAPDGTERVVSGASLRQDLAARQIALGRSFQWLGDVSLAGGVARYRLTPPPGLSVDPAMGLHPGLIDSLLQPAALLLAFGTAGETFVPVAMERFALHRLPVAYPLQGTARRSPTGGAAVDLRVTDAEGRLILRVDGFELHRLTAPDDLSQALVELRWMPVKAAQVWQDRPAPQAYLSGPALHDPAFQARITAIGSPRDLRRTEDLEELALCYLTEALAQAGALPGEGQVLGRSQIATRLALAPEFERALDRLLFLMVRHGRLLDVGQGRWSGLPLADTLPAAEQARRIRARYGAAVESELALLESAGGRLAPILSGQTDPLEALFPGGDLSAATALYRDSAGFAVLNSLVGRLVADIAAAAPADHVMRVLEIGAGTGATTHHVLPHLHSDRSAYVFTDISNLFLKAARDSFAGVGFIDYRLFDVENDPSSQGLASDFDLVIASNVLHATASIAKTLQNASSLLRPGGYLVLLEVNEPTVPVDLTFGLLKGWWRFHDHDLRPDYPLLSRAQWIAALSEAGFAGAAAADVEIPTPGGLQTVFVAQVPERAEIGTFRVVGDDHHGIAAALRTFGRSSEAPDDAAAAVVLVARQPDDAEVLRNLATAPSGGKVHVVMEDTADTAALWGLMRVLRHELPDRAGRIIGTAAGVAADRIAAALTDPHGPDELRLMPEGGMTPALVPLSLSLPDPVRMDPDATYLITGGMGGLGLRLARGLIAQGARHVALVGRTRRDGPELEDLLAQGDVTVHLADVTDAEAMAGVLATVTAERPLKGVFHLAGILRPSLIEAETRLLDNMAAKHRGAAVLDQLCADMPEVQHFVLFSSVAAWLGVPGQAAYAAGNAALDGLAQRRRALGRPALVVNWGRWADIGMVGTLREPGAIAPDAAIALLFRLMATDLAQVGVLPGGVPQGDELAGATDRSPAAAPPGRVAQAGPSRTTGSAQDVLIRQIGLLTGTATPPDPARTLPELGLDSLMCIDLRGRIQEEFGVRLGLGTMMETPLSQLVQDLDAARSGRAAPPMPDDASAAPEVEFVL